jgi:resuscitation-promoting factor RpfB
MQQKLTKIKQTWWNTWQKLLPKRLRRSSFFNLHPHLVPVITIGSLILLTATGLGIYKVLQSDKVVALDTRIVIISHDKQQQIVPSKQATVGNLLKELQVVLGEGDRVEPGLNTPINQDQFRINIYRALPVQIVDEGQRSVSYSAATTPRSITRQAGVNTFSEDYVESQPVDSFLASGAIGTQVVIDRSTPVNVNLYGAPVVMRTHASTIRELLDEKNIELKAQDMVKPGLDVPLVGTAGIAVIRNGINTVTVQEDVPAPVQTVIDNNLSYGTSSVRQQGTPGKKTVTYEINTQNGREVSRKIITSNVIQQPVAQIVVQGANLSGIKGDMARAGIAPGDYQYVDYIVSRESGWCPTKAQGQYGKCPPYAGFVPSTGGYGLCQSTPGSKMATAGADWATNPVTQLKWCTGYAKRYGGWAGAYNFWIKNHWW